MQEMTCDEFIDLTRLEPSKWICYCEILMTSEGNIILARPSHQYAAIAYYASKENISFEQAKDFFKENYLSPNEYCAGKYSLVSLWYDYAMYSNTLTELQNVAIRKLIAAGLISSTLRTTISNEYQHYLFRQNIKQ